MADEILKCDGTDEVHKPDWEPIVGDKTLDDGGRVGDLLAIARVHLEDAKLKGELREQDAGEAYSNAILQSFQSAIAFELAYSKSQFEVCYLKAQIDKLACDCENDTKRTDSQVLLNNKQMDKIDADIVNDNCRAQAECALKEQQTLTEVENTHLVQEKIETEEFQNKVDGVMDNQIQKIKEDILLSTANRGHVEAQTLEIPLESARRDCTTASQCSLNEQQIDKLICDCTNDTNMTDSKISLNAAQENKMACDCCNSSIVSAAQGRLYDRQAEGFDDNANQKLYDSQLQAWSMVFADTDLAEVTDSINEENINRSYKRLANRLSSGAGLPCSLHRKSVDSSDNVTCTEEPCDTINTDTNC